MATAIVIVYFLLVITVNVLYLRAAVRSDKLMAQLRELYGPHYNQRMFLWISPNSRKEKRG
jgi:hypothetical protein